MRAEIKGDEKLLIDLEGPNGKNLAAHKDDDRFDDISVCHECPKSVISESQLRPICY